MKVALSVTATDVRPCHLPHVNAAYVVAAGACPACKGSPFEVAGHTPVRGHASVTSPAICVACKADVGQLVATFDTIFGLEEDAAVLHGRHRVYG